MPITFVWTDTNRAKIHARALTESQVEAVFSAADAAIAPADAPGRFMCEGTTGGHLLRVVFSLSGPQQVYVVTAHRISPLRRKAQP